MTKSVVFFTANTKMCAELMCLSWRKARGKYVAYFLSSPKPNRKVMTRAVNYPDPGMWLIRNLVPLLLIASVNFRNNKPLQEAKPFTIHKKDLLNPGKSTQICTNHIIHMFPTVRWSRSCKQETLYLLAVTKFLEAIKVNGLVNQSKQWPHSPWFIFVNLFIHLIFHLPSHSNRKLWLWNLIIMIAWKG